RAQPGLAGRGAHRGHRGGAAPDPGRRDGPLPPHPLHRPPPGRNDPVRAGQGDSQEHQRDRRRPAQHVLRHRLPLLQRPGIPPPPRLSQRERAERGRTPAGQRRHRSSPAPARPPRDGQAGIPGRPRMKAPWGVRRNSRTSEPGGPNPQRTARVDETLVPRWVPYLFAVLSLALVPGIARVFASAAPLHLVTHWRLAWGGFDMALAALLATTRLALFRRSALAEVLAAMTATLLCCDAWVDVLSSVGQGTGATVIAIGEAALVELPLAALFAWVAVRFAWAVAEARPSLQRAGFRICHRRLMPPPGDYPALLDAEAAGSQPRWRQWTPRGHAE